MTTPYGDPTVAPAEFRARIQAKYASDFRLCFDILTALENAYAQQVSLANEVHRAVDMLMLQAHKAYASVYVLAVRAHIEDAATITRRLLEVAVQAAYITQPEEEPVQRERAGRYLAHLWTDAPKELKAALPENYRAAWDGYHQTHKHLLPDKRRSWGPSFREMFRELGRDDTYEQDYSFLSAIAHGSPPNLIYDYRGPTVEVRPDRHVPLVLRYAARYCLAITGIWNELAGVIDDGVLSDLARRAA